MKNLFEQQDFQAQLIESIIAPLIPQKQRSRASPTKIKALYHLYQLNKNIGTRWKKENFQGRRRIAEGANISQRHFEEFIVHPDFKLFATIQHRAGTTSIYTLHQWVIDFFNFFEKKGMMRNFRQDFNDWKCRFLKRFRKWLLPLLQKGVTLQQILMNKLSTETPLKGADPNSLKGAGIKPSGSSYQALQGSRSKPEQSPLPVEREFSLVSGLLRSRFLLKDGDVNMIMKRYDLDHHKEAMSLMNLWKSRGMEIKSPVLVYQTCLNKTRRMSHGRS